MIEQLVYLHIPKSGGTSQRLAFYDVYGEEKVFWHGINSAPRENHYGSPQFQDFTVVGGHQPLSYYPDDQKPLYLSVVREPISRAISLYSYYCKPAFAEPHFVEPRKNVFNTWQKRGMDSDSLLNSLQNCPEFLREVQNYQCRYLSRYEYTFDGVLKTIDEIDIILADVDSTAQMNERLSSLLEWGPFRERRANSSLEDTHQFILQEPGVKETLTNLLDQDQLLYEYIAEKHQGILESTSKNISPRLHGDPALASIGGSNHVLPWTQIQMYCKGFIALHRDGSGSLGVAIINHSAQDITYREYPDLAICYEAYDRNGEQIDGKIFSQPMQIPLVARGKVTLSLDVSLPTTLIDKASGIRVWLSVKPGEPVTMHNPLHLAAAQIFPAKS